MSRDAPLVVNINLPCPKSEIKEFTPLWYISISPELPILNFVLSEKVALAPKVVLELKVALAPKVTCPLNVPPVEADTVSAIWNDLNA